MDQIGFLIKSLRIMIFILIISIPLILLLYWLIFAEGIMHLFLSVPSIFGFVTMFFLIAFAFIVPFILAVIFNSIWNYLEKKYFSKSDIENDKIMFKEPIMDYFKRRWFVLLISLPLLIGLAYLSIYLMWIDPTPRKFDWGNFPGFIPMFFVSIIVAWSMRFFSLNKRISRITMYERNDMKFISVNEEVLIISAIQKITEKWNAYEIVHTGGIIRISHPGKSTKSFIKKSLLEVTNT